MIITPRFIIYIVLFFNYIFIYYLYFILFIYGQPKFFYLNSLRSALYILYILFKVPYHSCLTLGVAEHLTQFLLKTVDCLTNQYQEILSWKGSQFKKVCHLKDQGQCYLHSEKAKPSLTQLKEHEVLQTYVFMLKEWLIKQEIYYFRWNTDNRFFDNKS